MYFATSCNTLYYRWCLAESYTENSDHCLPISPCDLGQHFTLFTCDSMSIFAIDPHKFELEG